MTADRRAALVKRVAKVIALARLREYERWLEMAFHSKVSRKRYPAQAEAAIALIRAEVLEEAARVADYDNSLNGDFIAAAIRALKEDHNDTE